MYLNKGVFSAQELVGNRITITMTQTKHKAFAGYEDNATITQASTMLVLFQYLFTRIINDNMIIVTYNKLQLLETILL